MSRRKKKKKCESSVFSVFSVHPGWDGQRKMNGPSSESGRVIEWENEGKEFLFFFSLLLLTAITTIMQRGTGPRFFGWVREKSRFDFLVVTSSFLWSSILIHQQPHHPIPKTAQALFVVVSRGMVTWRTLEANGLDMFWYFARCVSRRVAFRVFAFQCWR